MQSDSSLFAAGVGIGLIIAILGGLFDFWLSTRGNESRQARQVPGCILYVAGILGLIGAVALLISVIVFGGIGPAVILGAGVLGGFYAGFALLLIIYALISRFWPR